MGGSRRYLPWLVLLSLTLAAAVSLAWLARGTPASFVAAATAAPAPSGTYAPQDSVRHSIDVVARRYAFSPDRIEVQENDLVKVTFSTEDIPHSFTVDEYRIAKRAAPGSPVVFEFRADRTGTFRFYCNLTADAGCRRMQGDLVVRPR